MRLLLSYLRRYWRLVLLALGLAAVNQIFSLLDPLIFRHVIDQYATRFDQYTTREFVRGVSLLLLAAVGVAFVSRVAKNFQDYFINVVTQRLGAEIYSDGIRHSLDLPYQVFEHHRIAPQHRAREEPGPREPGGGPAQRHHREDPAPGAEEGPLPAQPELHPGDLRERAPHQHHVPDALPDLHPRDHGGTVLLALHLLVLHLRPLAGAGERDQRLPRGRGLAAELPEDPRHSPGAQAPGSRPPAGAANPRLRGSGLHASDGQRARPEWHLVRPGARRD